MSSRQIPSSQVIFQASTRARKARFLILSTLGNLLILASLGGITATFGPVAWQEGVYRYRQLAGIRYVVADTAGGPANAQSFDKAQDERAKPAGRSPLGFLLESPDRGPLATLLDSDPKVRVLTPVDTDFSIVIPKIGANARVLTDVDPADENTYLEALNRGVAHAAGTGYPGVESWNRNIYLFAHSTDYPWRVPQYNALFYLIKELEAGDQIDVFYQGKRFAYNVVAKKIVGPKEVSYITTPQNEEQLTLQTCWPPGTTLARLIVIAKPVSQVSQAR